jgi:hypothetical protein
MYDLRLLIQAIVTWLCPCTCHKLNQHLDLNRILIHRPNAMVEWLDSSFVFRESRVQSLAQRPIILIGSFRLSFSSPPSIHRNILN